MNLLETTLVIGIAGVLVTAGYSKVQGHRLSAEADRDLALVRELALEYRRTHCRSALSMTPRPLHQLGTVPPVADPAAWSVSFRAIGATLHYTAADRSRTSRIFQQALVRAGGTLEGTTVTLTVTDVPLRHRGREEFPRIDSGREC